MSLYSHGDMTTTLSQFIVGNPSGNVSTSGTIRYYSNIDFTVGDVQYKKGGMDSPDFFLDNTWTKVGSQLVVPVKSGFPTTVDAVPNTARISAYIYDSRGIRIGSLFENWQIPAVPSGPLSRTALIGYNGISYPLRSAETLSKADFMLMLESLTQGRYTETPAGLVDSSNTTFLLSHTPLVGSEHVFSDGIRLTSGDLVNGYTISGPIITTIIPPESPLIVTYFTSTGLVNGGLIPTQLQESGGPTDLSLGAIADGKYLKRSGTTIIGHDPNEIKETSTLLTVGSVLDGQFLKRVGSTVVSGIVPDPDLSVDVSRAATAGLGTFASPWTGWDTAITWAERTTYRFPSGVYGYTVSPNFGKPGLRIVGTSQTFLKYTGSGIPFLVDGTTHPGGLVLDVRVENITIDGGGTTSDGMFIRMAHHCLFYNVRVRNLTGIGFHVVSSVLNTYFRPQCSGPTNDSPGISGWPAFTATPIGGMRFEAGTFGCNASTIIDPNISHMNGYGIWGNALISSAIIGGASEVNTTYGIVLTGTSESVSVTGTEVEHNVTANVLTNAKNVVFRDLLSFNGTVIIGVGSVNNRLEGGAFNAISIEMDAFSPSLAHLTYGYSGGTITDSGSINPTYDHVVDTTGKPFSLVDAVTTTIRTISGITTSPFTRRGGIFTIPTGGVYLSYEDLNLASVYTAKWKVIFLGVFYDTLNGAAATQLAPYNEVTAASPTLTISAGVTLTITLGPTGIPCLLVKSNTGTIIFDGQYWIISNDFSLVGADSFNVKGAIRTAGPFASSGGVSSFFKGADVASAAAIAPTGNLFHVTGTTNITSITSTGIAAGTEITIIFDGVLTFTDGSNLSLAGNFVTSADDTITLKFDGTNWYEICRSVN